jgi:hypothetical protein
MPLSRHARPALHTACVLASGERPRHGEGGGPASLPLRPSSVFHKIQQPTTPKPLPKPPRRTHHQQAPCVVPGTQVQLQLQLICNFPKKTEATWQISPISACLDQFLAESKMANTSCVEASACSLVHLR